MGAAKCGQASWPLLGAKHVVGPWGWGRGEDKYKTHCKLIGHKTFLRTRDEKDSTTKAAFVFVSGGSLTEAV